ncbi:hypothetical protein DASC09_048610 [Saccharomycopsis crataegensis]|uniref:EF-hand domain-containing protein n=1 Tax=Saccharomycopsis crataegensis TaxID=43959 RepID=A0AAV5QSN2_9ASCO|nr:hypothetical protein DASC09_048610 [Saccharomycopsis crataegensis]
MSDDLPHFATPAQAYRRSKYNLYQQQPPQQQPLYRQQPPQQIQQPVPIPAQATGQEQQQYENMKRVFMGFDRDRSNSLDINELSQALYNADGSRFDLSTIQMMVKLFDEDNSKTLDFREFYFLTKYLNHWNNTFRKADSNRSGTISLSEYVKAVESFGYRIRFETIRYIFNSFASGAPPPPAGYPAAPPRYNSNYMKFDKFVESLIWILKFTSVFRKYDYQGNARATFGFEQFLCEGFSLIR